MKILKVILTAVVVIVLFVFGSRTYNDRKYGVPKADSGDIYDDPTDLSRYPETIDGIEVKRVSQGAMQGFHMIPKEKTKDGVVVCYGGSEGAPGFGDAVSLAKEGYETLAVFMFGMDHQPKTLARIPLEQFEDVLAYIDENTDGGPLTVTGASKGAEYALNLAVNYDEIDNLILTAPSAYTFAGLDFEDYGSSWTKDGKELPYIDIKKSDFGVYIKNLVIPMMTKAPVAYRKTYETAVGKDWDNYEKLIQADQTKANILLLAGGKDEMWQSADMAKLIEKEREGSDAATEVVIYPDAGHIFAGNGIINTPDMRLAVGGTREANEQAGKESRKAIREFLETYHK